MLDPEGPEEWAALRAHAHALVDASLDRLQSAREGRVWTPPPAELKASLQAPLPREGTPIAQVATDLAGLLPYGVGNTHPRFFGWVHGAGCPSGVLPELVGAALNANCGGREHAAIYVEKQVLRWARELMGFPADCGALLTTGTSMATVVALKAARDQRLGYERSRKGGVAAASERLVGYAAAGTHSCVKRAFDILGLGSDQLRMVPVGADFTMDVDALRDAVDADAAAGLTPFLVVATAGSVNVGAIDPLAAIADACAERGLWMHVDGAFGAAAALSATLRPRLAGMERAHSLAFDFHKWFHVNYDCGCVLVREADAQLLSFSDRAEYLASDPQERGIAAGSPWPTDLGPELSRGFRALKVWSHLREHGADKLGDAVLRNVEQARELARAVEEAADFELLAPQSLQIVAFRYVGGKPSDLDALNQSLVVELQERGIAAPSTTRVGGNLAIRVNITNHRTRAEDLELLLREARKVGAELAAN